MDQPMATQGVIHRNDEAGRKQGSMNAPQGPPYTENGEFVGPKAAARFESVQGQVLSEPWLFAAQKAVLPLGASIVDAAWAPTSA